MEPIFFDSGTGGGKGVRIRVTNQKGESLLYLLKDKLKGRIDPDGSMSLGFERTNNYGELAACYLALRIALITNSKTIYGDSELVLKYWARGQMSKKIKLSSPETFDLSQKTSIIREHFEKNSGKLKFISGASNPADLGYHK